jgi:hypothetical protein
MILIQVGNKIPAVESQPFKDTATPTVVVIEEQEANNLSPQWCRAHCNTLENLLRAIAGYYRQLYLFPALQTLWLKLHEEDIAYVKYLRQI